MFPADRRVQGLAQRGREAEVRLAVGSALWARCGLGEEVLRACLSLAMLGLGEQLGHSIPWRGCSCPLALPHGCSRKAEPFQGAAALLLMRPSSQGVVISDSIRGNLLPVMSCFGSQRCSIIWLPLHFTHLWAGEAVTHSLVLAGLQFSLRQGLDFP